MLEIKTLEDLTEWIVQSTGKPVFYLGEDSEQARLEVENLQEISQDYMVYTIKLIDITVFLITTKGKMLYAEADLEDPETREWIARTYKSLEK